MVQHGFSLLLGGAWDTDQVEYGYHFRESCSERLRNETLILKVHTSRNTVDSGKLAYAEPGQGHKSWQNDKVMNTRRQHHTDRLIDPSISICSICCVEFVTAFQSQRD